MKVCLKIWLEKDGQNVLGDGRLQLLKTVEEAGSINAAAAKMGLSYRHAWGQLQKLEKRLGMKLIEPKTGGKGGGGTKLTEKAKKFLSDFEEIRNDVADYAEKKFTGFNIK